MRKGVLPMSVGAPFVCPDNGMSAIIKPNSFLWFVSRCCFPALRARLMQRAARKRKEEVCAEERGAAVLCAASLPGRERGKIMVARKKNRRLLQADAALVCVMLLFAGCSQPGSDEAKAACESFLQAYVSLDGEEVAKSLGGMNGAEEFSDLQGAVAQRIAYQTKGVQMEEGRAVVSTVITAIDLEAVFSSLPEGINSAEGAKEALLQAFAADDVPMREFVVEIELLGSADDWTVQMTPELSDALLGGYHSLMETLMEEAAS